MIDWHLTPTLAIFQLYRGVFMKMIVKYYNEIPHQDLYIMKSLCLLSIHKYNVKNIDNWIFTKNSYINVLIIVILFYFKNKNVYEFFSPNNLLSILSCFDFNTHNIINKNNYNIKRSHQK